jgi:hypothetical protein
LVDSDYCEDISKLNFCTDEIEDDINAEVDSGAK